jgi:hypothetical protein
MLTSDDVYEAEDAWTKACEEYGSDSDEAREALAHYQAVQRQRTQEQEDE